VQATKFVKVISNSSLPGSTRQSTFLKMDARVKPAHDEHTGCRLRGSDDLLA